MAGLSSGLGVNVLEVEPVTTQIVELPLGTNITAAALTCGTRREGLC